MSAYRDGERTIVLIPARFSAAEERQWVTTMVRRLETGEARPRAYLGGRARPTSVRWVTNQNRRWGSCSPAEGTIRLSTRLRGMPAYVLDYVLLHELAHLLAPGHDDAFWELLQGYPRLERARGYLEGVSAAAGLAMSDDGDDLH